MMQKSYRINNMHCAACSAAVEREAMKTNGVIDCSVNLLTNTMTIDFDENVVSPERIKERIDSLGYEMMIPITNKTIHIRIEGMNCAACSAGIEKQIERMDGVNNISVNIATGQGEVDYDYSKIKLSEILDSIDSLGYKASLLEIERDREKEFNETERELKNMKRKVLLSAIFTVPLLYIAMGHMIFGDALFLPSFVNMKTNPFNYALIQWLLTIPVIIIGKHFLII